MARRALSFLFAASLVGGLGACQSALAQESFTKNLLTGLGIISSDRPEIDYKERPTLVVPKNKQALPEPQARGGARQGNWPVDANAKAESGGRTRDTALPLEQQELSRGRQYGANRVEQPQSMKRHYLEADPATMGTPLHQRLIGAFSDKEKGKDNTIVFTGENPRKRLIEPPPGYRTPSKNAPYGPQGINPYDPQSAQAKSSRAP